MDSAVIGKQEKIRVALLLGFIMLCIVFYLLQVLSNNHMLGLSNWFVGDGMTLSRIMPDASEHFPWSGLGRRQGIYLLHSLPYRYLGTFGFFVFNAMLVAILAWRYGSSLFLLFPFYLISLPLPSKDLVMLAFVLAWARAIASKSWGIGAFLILLMYYFRDGDMFISIGCTLAMLLVWSGIQWRPLAVLGVAIGGFLFVYGKSILGFIPIYGSYDAQYHSYSGIGCCSLSDYLVRLIGNSSNLALRTEFIDTTGGLSLLAVIGFVSGLSMMAAFCLTVYSFIKGEKGRDVALASLLLIIALAVLSISPFVQPRYLMPYAAAFFMLTQGRFSVVEWWSAFSVSLLLAGVGIALYSMLPIPVVPHPLIDNFSLF